MKFRKKIYLIIAFLCVMFISPVCLTVNAKTESEEECKIVIIERYINYAWGYCDEGIFIDMEGNIYKFNLSGEEAGMYNVEPPYGDELLEILYDIQKNNNPIGKVDTMYIHFANWAADKVDKSAEIAEKFTACDAGQETLYAVNGEGDIIEISSYGDYARQRLDIYSFAIKFIFNIIYE